MIPLGFLTGAFGRLLGNPKLWVAAALIGSLIGSYQMGKTAEKRANDMAVKEAVEAALVHADEVTIDLIQRERADSKLLQEVGKRDDQESIYWAAKSVPAGERARYQRMCESVSSVPADSCGPADPM